MSSSGSFSVASISGHRTQRQAQSGLSKHNSRLPVSAKSPIMTEWSLHPETVTRIFRTWGTPAVDMFATVHNTHLLQSPIQEPRALAIDALSKDWKGRLMYMFSQFSLLTKVIKKLAATQDGEIILIATWWPSQPWFPHLLRLCVWTTLGSSHTAETYFQNVGFSRMASHTICMHGGSHAALPSSRIFRRGLKACGST